MVLKSSDKNDPNIVREVFYHRQFDYPYITKLYEVIITETKVWMALEYCPGKELYDRVLSMHRVPTDECVQLFAQIVGGVHYAHSLNCVHRDLKLENILLDKSGDAKLTDFGFTRECMTKTTLETICGTTVYMAPELIERKSYDGFKIDIWSLGVILYTMINGSMPFDEDDETKTEWKIVHQTPQLNENIVTADAKDLILRLLAKNPNDRPTVEQILKHPFLQPFGSTILEETEKILVRQRRGTTQFHSKLERRLMKKLKRTGLDTQAIKNSIQKKKCDSLSALWLLLLEKEKRHERLNYPKRSKSLLSVRKVFDTSSVIDQPKPTDDDDVLQRSLEVSRVRSLRKSVIKDDEIKTPASKTSLDSFQVQRAVTTPMLTLSSNKEETTGKGNLFKKVSDFFKQKKYLNSNNGSSSNVVPSNNDSSVYSMATSSSYRKKNTPSPKKDVMSSKSSGSSSSKKTFKNKKQSQKAKESPSKKKDPLKETNINTQRNITSGEGIERKIKIDEPILKRFKSTASSDISRRASTLNFDNESFDYARSISNDDKRPVASNKARPASYVSQMSNDTYNSEYSTDGNTSSYKISDSSIMGRNNLESTGQNSSSVSDAFVGSGYSRKFIRRDMSIMSGASSTSDRSSRTDSFYDITTTSIPKIKNVGMPTNISLKDSVLPRFGTQHSWVTKRGYVATRHGKVGRRNSKRFYMKSPATETEDVIKEESSSSSSEGEGNNERGSQGFTITPIKSISLGKGYKDNNPADNFPDHVGLPIHSDSETISKGTHTPTNRTVQTSIEQQTRSLSLDRAVWNQIHDDSKSLIVHGTEDEDSDNADNEDNFFSED